MVKNYFDYGVKVVFAVTLFLLVSLLGVLGLSYTGIYSPAIDHVFEATVIDTPYNGSLSFTEEQVERINEKNSNRSEAGWCFDVEDGEVSGLEFSGYGGTRSIELGCTGRSGKLHTHGLLMASAELSPTDYNSLVVSGDKASCVVSGEVEKGVNPVSLNCFHLMDSDLYRYNLVVS